MRVKILLPVLAALLWPLQGSYGQTERAALNPDTPAPAIVTKVEEVSLDLVIRNKKGQPVPDLKPGDLEITDDGSPAKISALHLVQGSSSGHIVTLVFDRLEPVAARQARDAAAQILKLAPASGVQLAVVKLGGRLRLFQEFTNNRQALKRAIGMATDGIKGDPGQGKRRGGEGTDQSGTRRLRYTEPNACSGDADSAGAVAAHRAGSSCEPIDIRFDGFGPGQQRLAGRKAVVYFAQGLELDSSGQTALNSAISAANRAGVSIYAIDVNGLDAKASDGLMAAVAMAGAAHAAGPSAGNSIQRGGGAPPSSVDTVAPGMRTNMGEQMGRIEMNGGSAGNESPLAKLSRGTGGAYIAGSENPRKALRRMLEDLKTYYEVSYVPAAQEDDRFRTVSVKPQRRGLLVQAPRGYFALAPGGSGSPAV